MGISSLFKKRNKSARRRDRRPADDHLGADHLGGDHLYGDGELRKREHLQTGTANGGIDKVKYRSEIGSSGTNKGFFKGEGEWADPMLAVSSKPRELSEQESHLGVRAVLSSKIDKLLGTDVLTDEAYAEHGGQSGTVSSLAKGEALRTDKDEGAKMAFSALDGRDANYQQSMWDLQLNDFLSGQVDRHGGNIFYDDETGRVRGIDNDLAFGDQFNETIGQPKGKFMDNSKHIRALPHMIDAGTADAVMGLDDDAYLDMLLGKSTDRQQLDPEEAIQAYERMQDLKLHIQAIRDGEGEGQIVEEWNADTYAEAMQHGEYDSSYLRYNQEAAEHFGAQGDNRKLKKAGGIKTFSGDKKRRKKRDKADAKAEKRQAKAARKADKRQARAARKANKQQRRDQKLGMSAPAAVRSGGMNLMDYLDPAM